MKQAWYNDHQIWIRSFTAEEGIYSSDYWEQAELQDNPWPGWRMPAHLTHKHTHLWNTHVLLHVHIFYAFYFYFFLFSHFTVFYSLPLRLTLCAYICRNAQTHTQEPGALSKVYLCVRCVHLCVQGRYKSRLWQHRNDTVQQMMGIIPSTCCFSTHSVPSMFSLKGQQECVCLCVHERDGWREGVLSHTHKHTFMHTHILHLSQTACQSRRKESSVMRKSWGKGCLFELIWDFRAVADNNFVEDAIL